MPGPRHDRLVLVASILLALGMAAAGILKLVGAEIEIEAFQRFGLPAWLMLQVGLTEVAVAILLLIPRLATLGAIIGVGIMMVAVPAHASAGEIPQILFPLAFGVGFYYVGWQRRAHLVEMLTR